MVGVGVVIVGIWGLLVLLMGVSGVFGGCWCFLGFVFVWSGSGVLGLGGGRCPCFALLEAQLSLGCVRVG